MSDSKKTELLGGVVFSEGPTLRVHLDFQLNSSFAPDGSLEFYLSIKQADSTSPEVKRGDDMITGDLLSTYSAPAGTFAEEGTADKWEEKVRAAFARRLVETMMFEASAHLADAGNYYLDEMGLDRAPVPRKELVEMHVNETRKRVSAYLGVKGQRSHWTGPELERAVRAMLSGITNSQARTLDNVAAALRKNDHYKKKAPASGEALGVLLKRFKLKWRDLKREAKSDS